MARRSEVVQTARRRVRIAAGLGALAALCGLAAWQHLAHRRDPAEAERIARVGRRVFAAQCAQCHGEQMEGRVLAGGVVVPPLRKPSFRFFFALLPAAMEDWAREQIAAGSPPMPAFGSMLDAGTLDALAFYVRAVNQDVAVP